MMKNHKLTLMVLLTIQALCMCSLRAQDIFNPFGLLNLSDNEWDLGDFNSLRLGEPLFLRETRDETIQFLNHAYFLNIATDTSFSDGEILLDFAFAQSTVNQLEGSRSGVLFEELSFAEPFGLNMELDANTENLIILVHGWNLGEQSNQYASGAFAELSNNLTDAINGTPWGLVQYHWEKDAATGGIFDNFIGPGAVFNSPVEAASIADSHGRYLAQHLISACPNLKKVMLMCHSAGAWVGYRSTKYLLMELDKVQVELVLMDPFVPGEIGIGTLLQVESPLTVERIHSLVEFGDRISLHSYVAGDGVTATLSCLTAFQWEEVQTGFAYATHPYFDWGLPHVELLIHDAFEIHPFLDKCDYGGHSGPIWFVADTVGYYLGEMSSRWEKALSAFPVTEFKNKILSNKYGFQDSLFTKWLEEEQQKGEILETNTTTENLNDPLVSTQTNTTDSVTTDDTEVIASTSDSEYPYVGGHNTGTAVYQVHAFTAPTLLFAKDNLFPHLIDVVSPGTIFVNVDENTDNYHMLGSSDWLEVHAFDGYGQRHIGQVFVGDDLQYKQVVSEYYPMGEIPGVVETVRTHFDLTHNAPQMSFELMNENGFLGGDGMRMYFEGGVQFADGYDGSPNESCYLPRGSACVIGPSRDCHVGSHDFTLDLWVKTAGNETMVLIEAEDGDSGFCGYITSEGTVAFRLHEGDEDVTITGTTSVCNDVFHHIIVSRHNGTIHITVDGVLEASASGVENICPLPKVPIRIGRGQGQYDRPYVGAIDNIFFTTDGGITSSDAANLYNDYVSSVVLQRFPYLSDLSIVAEDASNFVPSGSGFSVKATFTATAVQSPNLKRDIVSASSNELAGEKTEAIRLYIDNNNNLCGQIVWDAPHGYNEYAYRNDAYLEISGSHVADGQQYTAVLVGYNVAGRATLKLYVDGNLINSTQHSIKEYNFAYLGRGWYTGGFRSPWLGGIEDSWQGGRYGQVHGAWLVGQPLSDLEVEWEYLLSQGYVPNTSDVTGVVSEEAFATPELDLISDDDAYVFADSTALRLEYSNDPMDITRAQSFTLEARIRPNAVQNMPVIMKDLSAECCWSSNGWYLGIRENNALGIQIYDDAGRLERFDSAPFFNSGEWVSLAITVDYRDTNTEVHMYRNGEPVSIEQLEFGGTGVGMSDAPFMIGKHGNYDVFSGAVSMVRVWNVARSADEIQNSWRWVVSDSEEGLLGQWTSNDSLGGLTGHYELENSTNGF